MKRALVLLAVSLIAGVLVAQEASDSLRARVRALRAELESRTPPARTDAVTARRYDIAALLVAASRSRGRNRDLQTSFTVATDAGESEPYPTWRQETVLEFVAEAVGPDAGVELNAGILKVSGPPEIHKRIERLLASLAQRTRDRVIVEIEVVPAADGDDEAWAAGRSFGVRTALGRAHVPCTNGIEQAYSTLRERHYIYDYDEESAREAGIAKAYSATVSEGLAGDVLACLDRRGGGVLLHLRLNWQRLASASRTEETSHGPVTLPALDAVMLSTSAWLPMDRPVLLATCTRGMTPCHVVVRVRAAE